MDQVFEGMGYAAGKFSQSNHSNEISEMRYRSGFFKSTVFNAYVKLHFISTKFGLDTGELVAFFLNCIYNDKSFDGFVYKLGRFEKKHRTKSFDWAILGTTLKEFLTKKETFARIGAEVLNSLDLLIRADNILRIRNCKLEFLYADDDNKVRFFERTDCDQKVKYIVETIGQYADLEKLIHSDFLEHMKETLFLNGHLINYEVEQIFSRHYEHYLKNVFQTQLKK